MFSLSKLIWIAGDRARNGLYYSVMFMPDCIGMMFVLISFTLPCTFNCWCLLLSMISLHGYIYLSCLWCPWCKYKYETLARSTRGDLCCNWFLKLLIGTRVSWHVSFLIFMLLVSYLQYANMDHRLSGSCSSLSTTPFG